MNVAYAGLQVSGNVNTNDVVRTGTTYGTPTAMSGNPSTCAPTMSSNGSYTFLCNVPGEYNFSVPVCPSGTVSGCPTEL